QPADRGVHEGPGPRAVARGRRPADHHLLRRPQVLDRTRPREVTRRARATPRAGVRDRLPGVEVRRPAGAHGGAAVSSLAERLRSAGVLRLIRIAIGLVFVGSGIAKIGETAWLAQSVHHFHLAPAWSEHAIAITLPWIELLAGFA